MSPCLKIGKIIIDRISFKMTCTPYHSSFMISLLMDEEIIKAQPRMNPAYEYATAAFFWIKSLLKDSFEIIEKVFTAKLSITMENNHMINIKIRLCFEIRIIVFNINAMAIE